MSLALPESRRVLLVLDPDMGWLMHTLRFEARLAGGAEQIGRARHEACPTHKVRPRQALFAVGAQERGVATSGPSAGIVGHEALCRDLRLDEIRGDPWGRDGVEVLLPEVGHKSERFAGP